MSKEEKISPLIHVIIAGMLALNGWYLSALAITESVLPQHFNIIKDVVLVLTGAYIAFLFRSIELRKNDKRKQRAAFNRCIVTYIRQITILKELFKDLQEWHQEDELRTAVEAVPYYLPEYLGVKQDIESLNFLIASHETEIYIATTISQESFDQAIHTVRARSDYFDREIIPKLATLEEENLLPDISSVKKVLGIERERRLIHLTKEMYEVLPRNIEIIDKNLDQIFICAKKKFPDSRFAYWKDRTPPHQRSE